MTCKSDGDIQRMLALLRVEGLGAGAAEGAGADKPARPGYFWGAYASGIDSVTAENNELKAEKKGLEADIRQLKKKVADLEDDVKWVGRARDDAQTQLSKLRADEAREKKEHAVKWEKAVKEAQEYTGAGKAKADEERRKAAANERGDWHTHRHKEEQEAEQKAYTVSLARHRGR